MWNARNWKRHQKGAFFNGGIRMKNFIEAAQYAFAALGGALGAVMGGFDGFLYALYSSQTL